MHCPECEHNAWRVKLVVCDNCEINGSTIVLDFNCYYLSDMQVESIICDNCGYRLNPGDYHLPKDG